MPDTLPFWLHSVGVAARRTPYFKGKWRVVDWVFKRFFKRRRYSEDIHLEHDLIMRCDLWDEGPHAIWWCGTEYERHETRFVDGFLQVGMVFFDIGANVGYYTLMAARRVGDAGRVHGFEPVSRQYDTLEANVRASDLHNVVLNRTIVSERSGTMTISLGPEYHSGIASVCPDPRVPGQTELVASIRLDDYVQQRGLGRVDIIKIDVEGHELSVLNGARRTLTAFKPMLLIEVKRSHLKRAGTSPEQLFLLLNELGYAAWRICAGGRIEKMGSPRDGKLVLFKPR